jgi:hypothetical protein
VLSFTCATICSFPLPQTAYTFHFELLSAETSFQPSRFASTTLTCRLYNPHNNGRDAARPRGVRSAVRGSARSVRGQPARLHFSCKTQSLVSVLALHVFHCFCICLSSLDSDPTLPLYYAIKNSILIACALDDWRDADIFRGIAESIYQKTLSKATSEHDEDSLELLKDVAIELKQLNEYREEDMFELTGIRFVDEDEMDDAEEYEQGIGAMDDEIAFPDGYSDVSEDDVQHKALDFAAGDGASKDFDLPVRTKEAAEAPPKPPKPPSASHLSTQTRWRRQVLRRKKRSCSTSGASHAHEFNKSIGQSGTSLMDLRDLFEQEQDGEDGN